MRLDMLNRSLLPAFALMLLPGFASADTLNVRGNQLYASSLVKNFLLWTTTLFRS